MIIDDLNVIKTSSTCKIFFYKRKNILPLFCINYTTIFKNLTRVKMFYFIIKNNYNVLRIEEILYIERKCVFYIISKKIMKKKYVIKI